MTSVLCLHVGAPKSGTTYLQQILEENRDRLSRGGVLLVGETHLDRIHAAMVVREDPRLDRLGSRAKSSWQRLVAQVGEWPGHKAILSYELFAGASDEQAQRALADLAGIDVHVVVTARDFGKAVPSAWQERLKFALTTPLEQWTPRPESAGPRAEWGWRTMDPAGVAARWGAGLPPERVHIVSVPRDPEDKHELWRRFAAACDLDVPGLNLDVERANESMGLVAAELLRRVNEKLTAPFTTDREHALWLRDTLAHRILATLDREPIGITDAQYADAQRRSEDSIGRVTEAGYDVRGDLDDLRATRSGVRTPGEAADAELLDAALHTIVKLLALVRERSASFPPQEPVPEKRTKLTTLGKRMVERGVTAQVRRETAQLEARVRELEAELQRGRALQLRVAELTDLVAELMLPAGDAFVSEAALRAYREDSL